MGWALNIMTTQQTVIIDTHGSKAARARLAPVSAVRLTDRFWTPRLEINRTDTLRSQYVKLEDSGCFDNFRRAAGTKDVPFQGYQFQDTDVYKWIEGASWALAGDGDPELVRMIDEAIDLIIPAQQPDGYLNTRFMLEKAGERWTTINTGANHMHEMYTAGHLFQAAAAHYRATGSTRLLDVATRLASHIAETFGPGDDKRHGVDGHPEVEMGLVELARITGDTRFLEAALYQIDTRLGMGRMNGAVYPYLPIREYDRAVGHAVCAVYLLAGVADACAENGDPTLLALLDRIWDNVTQQQMYLTGGIGPRWDNEAFGADYELPDRAYAETCASIGSIMWNARMLAIRPDAKYADLIERTLYNGFLAGLSLDGKQYFYQNPLADDGTHRREAWFGCACCPPNVARLLAQLPGYFYAVDSEGVFVNLYAAGHARLTLPSSPEAGSQTERSVTLVQKTDYPWDGHIRIEIESEGAFALRLRIPEWARGATLSVNGEAVESPVPGTYAAVARDWKPGDAVELILPMPVRRIVANPRAASLAGRVALMRGPLVYCFEQTDNTVDVRDIRIPPSAQFEASFDPDLLGGVVTLRGNAVIERDPAWDGRLYRDAADLGEGPRPEASVTAIPYYAWANREPGAMTAWPLRG
jgi:DUF1680 family protein